MHAPSRMMAPHPGILYKIVPPIQVMSVASTGRSVPCPAGCDHSSCTALKAAAYFYLLVTLTLWGGKQQRSETVRPAGPWEGSSTHLSSSCVNWVSLALEGKGLSSDQKVSAIIPSPCSRHVEASLNEIPNETLLPLAVPVEWEWPSWWGGQWYPQRGLVNLWILLCVIKPFEWRWEPRACWLFSFM